ncbi:MAG: hypothetical protein LBC92_03285 [Rickettsiales bacterium]|jgi:hypothetical protein|nr:hypothetical protein [Rickettsiales bacterium]
MAGASWSEKTSDGKLPSRSVGSFILELVEGIKKDNKEFCVEPKNLSDEKLKFAYRKIKNLDRHGRIDNTSVISASTDRPLYNFKEKAEEEIKERREKSPEAWKDVITTAENNRVNQQAVTVATSQQSRQLHDSSDNRNIQAENKKKAIEFARCASLAVNYNMYWLTNSYDYDENLQKANEIIKYLTDYSNKYGGELQSQPLTLLGHVHVGKTPEYDIPSLLKKFKEKIDKEIEIHSSNSSRQNAGSVDNETVSYDNNKQQQLPTLHTIRQQPSVNDERQSSALNTVRRPLPSLYPKVNMPGEDSNPMEQQQPLASHPLHPLPELSLSPYIEQPLLKRLLNLQPQRRQNADQQLPLRQRQFFK